MKKFTKKNAPTVIIIIVTSFLAMTSFGGCVKTNTDNLGWEISPDSKSQVIEKEINGIAFKFCLLNEHGKPATVFNEGENFSFYFSVNNNTSENLLFYPGFAYANPKDNGFCEVYTLDNQNIGKPFVFLGCDLIGIGAYPFNSEKNYVFEQQWKDMRDSTWRWEYGYYESSNQTPLPVGDYHTGFQYRFQFESTGTSTNFLDTTLTFKINFKIQ